MSETRQESQRWTSSIRAMIRFSEDIICYAKGLNQEAFVKDKRTFDATLRKIEITGLAASHVPKDVRKAYPHVEWRQIVATRNFLAHAFSGIDGDIIWDIVRTDIPTLIPQLEKLLADQEQDQP